MERRDWLENRAELERSLETERQGNRELKQQLGDERQARAKLQQRLEEEQQRSVELEQRLEGKQHMVAELRSQLVRGSQQMITWVAEMAWLRSQLQRLKEIAQEGA